MGVAPGANLISIKASDDDGNATVLDVIAGIQFAVDHKADYNIRVLNLSLESSASESYKTDPLDAAVEAAWFKGIFVVAAAGNRGPGDDAVSHAPGNDPTWSRSARSTTRARRRSPTTSRPAGRAAAPRRTASRSPTSTRRAPTSSRTSPRSSKYTELCGDCVSDGGEYIRAGGTSMAAPMVAGAAAIGFQLDPTLTPNRIKALLRDSDRPLTDSIDELSMVDAARRFFNDGGRLANQGLEPNTYIDPATGEIDYTRSRWSRSPGARPASCCARAGAAPAGAWRRRPSASYAAAAVDPTRSSWSRSSWSRSSWSTSWTK